MIKNNTKKFCSLRMCSIMILGALLLCAIAFLVIKAFQVQRYETPSSTDMIMDHKNMPHRINELGQMEQMYFAQDERLSEKKRKEIIQEHSMPIVGATYGDCYDSDGDALESKYYNGYTEIVDNRGNKERVVDVCTDSINLKESYCARTLQSDGVYIVQEWDYICKKGCADGACRF